jgi:hypothetical protein
MWGRLHRCTRCSLLADVASQHLEPASELELQAQRRKPLWKIVALTAHGEQVQEEGVDRR